MGMLYLLFKKDYFKSTVKNGIVELNALQFMVKQEKENAIYLLSEITDLRIYFNSYKDMQNGKARFDGDDNTISFRYNGVKNEFQFDVDSLQHQEELKVLLGTFYEKGIKFKEYFRGQRSFMHRTNLSFKEVQEFKAKYNAEWV
ncbi:hypothetical protein [Marinifilum fragile]|uniref:hypothetical protein n=1 Tax=Marinifilum fragile TaxID=570161 RepID=UPI002AA6FAAD|nr:hypothetical protein [Marinifilum fragile]